ncbi:MAG: hypothetical protein SNF60_07760 [Rikenellaceae bacterium]
MFDFIKRNMLLCIIIFLAVVSPSFLFGAMKFIVLFILGGIAIIYILSLVLGLRVQSLERDMRRGGGYRAKADDEGKVNIFKANSAAKEKKVSKDVGDYVDFEEIKEK